MYRRVDNGARPPRVDGAYRPPREFNYWNGLILMMLVMGLGLTGYLLP